MYSCGPPHINEQRLDDQLESIYNCSVPIQDVAWKICLERWTIETSGERDSGKSVPATQHDDDDDVMYEMQKIVATALMFDKENGALGILI